MAQPKLFRGASEHEPVCQRASPMGRNDLEKAKTYEVRLRFWRARGLLSTSGGILFATVSGECTRNAKSVVAVGLPKSRLPTASDATGSGEDGDISNNDRENGRAESEWRVASGSRLN